MQPQRTIEERFWSQVAIGDADECWERSGARSPRGYAVFKLGPRGSKVVQAHRFSWELTNGPIPEGMLVCHHCDNKVCVNPAHLFVGTHTDNMRDMFAKQGRIAAVGRANGRSKLTPEIVAEIKETYRGRRGERKAWCERLDIHRNTFGAIISGKTWRHVP